MSQLLFAMTLSTAGVSCLSAFAANGLMPPTDLKCEYRKNPLGIDTTKPRLSWHLEAADPNARGQRQRACQILVASTRRAPSQRPGGFLGLGAGGIRQVYSSALRWHSRWLRARRSGGKFASGTAPASPPPGASLRPGQWGCSNAPTGKVTGSDSTAAKGSPTS